MKPISPAVLLRHLAVSYIGVVLLFAASCTSSPSVVEVPAPAFQAQAMVAQALPRPTVEPTFTPPATTPNTPTTIPTEVYAETPTAIPTEVPTIAPTARPTLIPTAKAPEIPTRLIIPAINLDAPVVPIGWSVKELNGRQVSEWDIPNWRAAGWLKTSAPLGTVGNTILEGHNNVYGRVFESLDEVKEGDTLHIYAGSVVRHYKVTQRVIVPEKDQPMSVRLENAKWITPKDDERITLITCYPRTSNTHRLILVAFPQP